MYRLLVDSFLIPAADVVGGGAGDVIAEFCSLLMDSCLSPVAVDVVDDGLSAGLCRLLMDSCLSPLLRWFWYRMAGLYRLLI